MSVGKTIKMHYCIVHRWSINFGKFEHFDRLQLLNIPLEEKMQDSFAI